MADESEKNVIMNSYLAKKDIPFDKNTLTELLNRYGSLGYTRRRAQEFVAAAIRALADLKEGDAKDALIETAKFMASRAI